MAGALDSAFKNIAKQVVRDLGTALDTTVTYTRKSSPTYNIDSGDATPATNDTNHSIKVPVEFIEANQDENREVRRAKLYVTPDLIDDHQPTVRDSVDLMYAGSTRTAQVVNVKTYRGGQEYLYIVEVEF